MIFCFGPKVTVHALPDDVLADIFEYCVPWSSVDGLKNNAFPSHSSFDTTQPPWTISHVCSNWRAVILSLPRLWSTVRILNVQRFRAVDPRHVTFAQQLKLVFKRSEPMLLSLSFRTDRGLYNTQVLPVLLATMSRWKCLRFERTFPNRFHEVFNRKSLPLLTHLSVSFCKKPTGHTILDTPSLRYFEEENCDGLNLLEVPWAQITHYGCDGRNLGHATRMLDLRSLHVRDVGSVSITQVAPSTLAKLTNVYIVDADHKPWDLASITIPWLLSHFHLPSMRTLACTSVSIEDAQLDGIVNLSLSLTKRYSGLGDEIFDFLHSAPNIETLHIAGPYVLNTLLRSTDDNEEPILQKLRYLHATHTHVWDTDNLDPAVVIQHMQELGAPIELLSIYQERDVPKEHREISGVRVVYHSDREFPRPAA
ncbi:hypothetical protein CYLTODRAFT_426725 [Cylindrobasidium torrendii FP15055 ss-10]|uniref:Uncharacterized protein n=1 Tax=Cylindrobasidium torrendii FP15055 ss-10 TaxID=1314674 RepID=A0A0D7AXU2_9AGAR|nr:hypothetical protein CYLTODRAFT_426725 [Cylindrobasidium torrendii FP15055 ss-10]